MSPACALHIQSTLTQPRVTGTVLVSEKVALCCLLPSSAGTALQHQIQKTRKRSPRQAESGQWTSALETMICIEGATSFLSEKQAWALKSLLVKNVVAHQHVDEDLTRHHTWWVWEVSKELHTRKVYMNFRLKIPPHHHIQIGIQTSSQSGAWN